MDHEYIEQFAISHVNQLVIDEDTIEIYFKIDDLPYCLEVSRIKGTFRPRFVYHDAYFTCPICGLKLANTRCSPLDLKEVALFQRLIKFPAIRMEWLFIEH